MTTITVSLPDGAKQSHTEQTTALDIAKGISEGLARAVVAAEIDGRISDAFRPLGELTDREEIDLKLLTTRDREALDVLRHSCAHIMARAVMRLFDGVSLAFGPATGGGFYYDFDLEHKLTEDDFPAIEKEMKSIIKGAEPFERFVLSHGEALELCRDLKQDLKVEHLQTGLADEQSVSFYRQGEFVDLCRGPHVPNAAKIKAIKLLSVAGCLLEGGCFGAPIATTVRNRLLR